MRKIRIWSSVTIEAKSNITQNTNDKIYHFNAVQIVLYQNTGVLKVVIFTDGSFKRRETEEMA